MARGPSPEVFRRSWLTAMPEWVVAGGVSVAAGLAAHHFGLQDTWEVLAVIGLPIIWAGGRTMQWLCCTWTVKAGGIVTLSPGESICLPDRLYHEFWGEKGKGKVLLCEVSTVNDDTTDNRFHKPVGRFPKIDEDDPPAYLLFSEYPPRV